MEGQFNMYIVKFPNREETNIAFNNSDDNRIWIDLPNGKWIQTSLDEIVDMLEQRRKKDMEFYLLHTRQINFSVKVEPLLVKGCIDCVLHSCN
jgi:hypothetical protein